LIGPEFAQHQRRGDRALLDGSGQSQDLFPMRVDLFSVNRATNEFL
jgi:hypothetical protein